MCDEAEYQKWLADRARRRQEEERKVKEIEISIRQRKERIARGEGTQEDLEFLEDVDTILDNHISVSENGQTGDSES